MRILITGAGGFLGKHLIPALASSNELVGADLPGAEAPRGCEWREINSGAHLAEVVQKTQPELLIHAAFINRKPPQWTRQRYMEDVLRLNLPVFETCAELDIAVLLVSSSAVYGNVAGKEPIEEETARRPVSLYGLAKTTQEMLAEHLESSLGLRLLLVRLFNLIGPGQGAGMLLPDWLIQLRRIEEGGEPVLRVRHLATCRDFLDVRDAAAALSCLAAEFRAGEVVNAASEMSVSLREIASFLQSLCEVKFEILETETSPGETDVLSQCGSYEKLRRCWGWRDTITWKRSVEDLWSVMKA